LIFKKKKKFDNVLDGGFVEDLFFEKGNLGLKIREAIVPTVLWLGFFYSQLSIINSYGKKSFIPFVYHWSTNESKIFTNYVSGALIVSFWIILATSTYLVIRNNYHEKTYFAKHKLYDEEKMALRTQALDEFYTARFGDQESRQEAKYYVVNPEENFENGQIQALFEARGLEIK